VAEIQPLRALYYDQAVVGPLGDVVAPPYDVIDSSQRAALLERSPYNVVAVDLPQGEGDVYAAAGDRFTRWQQEGALVRDPEPALWAHTQDYTGPDGVRRTRRGFFCRVRIEPYGPGRVRPHERTHPGPKEDRLRLTRATRANISPIFSLYSDPRQAAWKALADVTGEPPWAEVSDEEGTVHRIWRTSDEATIADVQAATAGAELLIADGHHRYETMQAYAQERVEEGGGSSATAEDYQYILMCLVALEDPGLTIFPTHRVVSGLDTARQDALERELERDFLIDETSVEEIAPPPGAGPLELGYVNSREDGPRRLRLKDQGIADAALADHAPPYRELDTGVLEALVLKGALGLSDEDISHLNGVFYARDTEDALAMVRSGSYDAAFLLRPTRVDQVRDLAAAGENMPPKSTFFYPKLLTGLLFNSLS
jgi:uncharacterized protein (DUF1015 family)